MEGFAVEMDEYSFVLSIMVGGAGEKKEDAEGVTGEEVDEEEETRRRKKELGRRVAKVEERIAALELKRSAASRRALEALQASCPRSWKRRWVAANYYSLTMRERSEILRVPIPAMCKSMLLENKNWAGTDPFAVENAKYYLVVVQYAASFSAMRLRALLAEKASIPKSKFNFRVTDSGTCFELSGFEHGAVTPFGFLETRVPVILSKACTELAEIWMGGGHGCLKFGCSVSDFLHTFHPLVLDVSDARPDNGFHDSVPESDADSPRVGSLETPPTEGAAADAADDDAALSKLAFIVGRVRKVWPHPESDKLWCEEIDCGDQFGGVRTIASGLRAAYDANAFENRLVLVVANLKPRKLAGFLSQGMVLCASHQDRVVFVDPPTTARPGDRVSFDSVQNLAPATAKTVDKQKLFQKVQPLFTTNNGHVYYKDNLFTVSGLPCTAPIDDYASVS